MIEIRIENKQNYLNENYPFAEIPNLTDLKECIHCGNIIAVGDYRVLKDDVGIEYICCPHAPDCDGTVIDWIDIRNKPGSRIQIEKFGNDE
jgi:hypothetical protein